MKFDAQIATDFMVYVCIHHNIMASWKGHMTKKSLKIYLISISQEV